MERLESQLHTVVKSLYGQAALEREALLSELPSYPAIFQDLSVLNVDGKEITRISRLDVVTVADYRDLSQNDEFTIPKTMNTVYYGPIQVNKVTGEPSMIISVPMVDPGTGAVNGVVVANIRFKEIWDYIASIQESTTESIYILDAQHRVIAHLNPSVVLAQTRYVPPAEDGIAIGLHGVSSVVATNKITFNQQDFLVVAEKPVSDALALALQAVIVTAILLVAALLVATILGVGASRRIV